jgi:hypothetical protein
MGNFFKINMVVKFGIQNTSTTMHITFFYFQKVLTPPNNDMQIVLLSQIQHGININKHIFIAMGDMLIIKLYATYM